MTLTQIPESTLADVLKLLSNQSYRNKILKRVTDETIIQFWKDEFDQMPEAFQKEAISPIQNKVGQFVTSPMIRRIIGNPKSSISIDDIMNQGKILLVNLSQGRLGEDNAALLGAMMITKFQLAAMHRVHVPKEERLPFYLYVDEFQNFATNSFVKILSEARKYGLSLLLANQYMAQIPEPIQKAILGNAGSLITFSCGADDANILHKEFAEVFSDNDLVNLAKYQIAIKLMIDGHSSRPFLAHTLPLPNSSNSNREKVIKVSRERWTRRGTDGEELEDDTHQLAVGVDTDSPQSAHSSRGPKSATPDKHQDSQNLDNELPKHGQKAHNVQSNTQNLQPTRLQSPKAIADGGQATDNLPAGRQDLQSTSSIQDPRSTIQNPLLSPDSPLMGSDIYSASSTEHLNENLAFSDNARSSDIIFPKSVTESLDTHEAEDRDVEIKRLEDLTSELKKLKT